MAQAPVAPAPTQQQAAQVTAMPSDPNGFRVRDFSPEGGRRAAQAAPDATAPAAPPAAAVAPAPSNLDYYTQARIPVEPAAQVPPAPSTTSATPAAPGIPTEQTLTRRELRALQQAEQLASGQPLDELALPQEYNRTPAAPAEPVAPLVAHVPDFVASAFPPAPEPSVNTALTNAITEFDRLAQAESQPTSPTRGSRHWSVEADHEDEVLETTVNRTVGSASATTSALVLPEIPGGADIRGPLTRTGEIMLTGSIDLPHTLSSTGATARFDHGGIDALFDAGDAEVISTDSAPVRAIRAVSTHNSGQGVIHTQKPKGTRALTALLIAASAMAVVVAGLLIAAFALNVF